MSQHHVTKAEQLLNVGKPAHLPNSSLADYDIPADEVLAISDEWWFDPDDSYCPVSDFPDDICAPVRLGVSQSSNGKLYIVGDNGMSAFMFQLSKRPDKWSGTPYPVDPDNFWVDDVTGELVNAKTGERSLAPADQA